MAAAQAFIIMAFSHCVCQAAPGGAGSADRFVTRGGALTGLIVGDPIKPI
jgi:hypothetical protein